MKHFLEIHLSHRPINTQKTPVFQVKSHPRTAKMLRKKNVDAQHTPGIQLTVYTDLPSHTHQDTEHREHTDLYSRLNKRNSSHQHMALNTCWGHAHVENAH